MENINYNRNLQILENLSLTFANLICFDDALDAKTLSKHVKTQVLKNIWLSTFSIFESLELIKSFGFATNLHQIFTFLL